MGAPFGISQQSETIRNLQSNSLQSSRNLQALVAGVENLTRRLDRQSEVPVAKPRPVRPDIKTLLAQKPDDATYHNDLGYIWADHNMNLEEAEKHIRKALEIDRAKRKKANPNLKQDEDRDNGAYLDSLGWVLFRLNKLPEAEETLRQAIEYMSRDATVHDHLGEVYLREGKIKQAVEQFQSSVKEWQTSSPSEMDHAEIAKVQKKLDDAKIRLAKETGAKRQ